MFQAEPILWLQSFESPLLTGILATVSWLGLTPVYIALILGLAFAFRLRPSLSVLLALLIAGTLVQTLKDGFALPRPSHVDERVEEPADPEPTLVEGRGAAATFWTLPAERAVEAVRAVPGVSFGLPSGHVGSAVAFLFGAAYFFRSRGVLLFALFWAPLMAVSRMYLGRHFLVDVLGGVVVGLVGVGVAVALLWPLSSSDPTRNRLRALGPLAAVALVALLLAPFVPVLDAENVGRLAGLSTVFCWLMSRGLPSDGGSEWKRLARVGIAVLVYLATSHGVEALAGPTGLEDTRTGELLSGLLLTSVTLGGGVAICSRLGLYGD